MYQQIVDGVKSAVAKGLLRPGDKLPSVRELSMEQTINHNTVAKAYQELEREHVIEVIRGRGTFVAIAPSVPNAPERLAELRATLTKCAIEAHHLRMTDDEMLNLLREVLLEVRGQDAGMQQMPSVGGEPSDVHHRNEQADKDL